MKCDNCGNNYNNSLTCPLCGHRQGKLSHCNVCGTVIHLGQPRCPNCGNVTKYEKRDNINNSYISKYAHNKIDTTNYAKHSEASHVYKQQELYDYKNNEVELKKRFEEARSLFTKPKKTKSSKGLASKIISILAVVLSLGIGGISIYSEIKGGKDNNYEEVRNTDMEIGGTNGNLQLAGNYQQTSYTYFDGDNFYILGDNYIYNYDRYFDEQPPFVYGGGQDLYVENNHFYFDDYDSYVSMNFDTTSTISLFKVRDVLPIANNKFLYNIYDENGLYLYDNGATNQLTKDEINNFTFDYVSELVYYSKDGKLNVIDLMGNKKYDLDLGIYDNFYVNDGDIYFLDYRGINLYRFGGEVELICNDSEIYHFIVMEKGLVFTTYDYELKYYEFDTDDILNICDNVDIFNVAGDKVVFTKNDDEKTTWYIADPLGEIAYLEMNEEE